MFAILHFVTAETSRAASGPPRTRTPVPVPPASAGLPRDRDTTPDRSAGCGEPGCPAPTPAGNGPAAARRNTGRVPLTRAASPQQRAAGVAVEQVDQGDFCRHQPVGVQLLGLVKAVLVGRLLGGQQQFAADHPAVGRLAALLQRAVAHLVSPLEVPQPAQGLGPAGHQVAVSGEQFQGFPRPQLGLRILGQLHQHLDLPQPAADQRLVQFEGPRVELEGVFVQPRAPMLIGPLHPVGIVAATTELAVLPCCGSSMPLSSGSARRRIPTCRIAS